MPRSPKRSAATVRARTERKNGVQYARLELRVPAEAIEAAGLADGDTVRVTTARGRVTMRREA